MASGDKISGQDTVGLVDLLVPLIDATVKRILSKGERPDLDALVGELQEATNVYRLRAYSECSIGDVPDGAVEKVRGSVDRNCCRVRFGATASLRGGSPKSTRSSRRTR